MPDQIVDSLFFQLGLDDTRLTAGLEALARKVRGGAEQIAGALTKTGQNAERTFGTTLPNGVNAGMNAVEARFSAGFRAITRQFFAPLAAAMAANRLFGAFLNEGESLEYLSRRLRIGVEDIQKYGNAFERAGGSARAFQGSLRAVQRNIGEIASGWGWQKGAPLAMLGVGGLRKANGELKTALDLTREVAAIARSSRFSGARGQERFRRLAGQAGFDESTVDAMLNMRGGESLDKLLERQERLGVLTAGDAKLAAQFKNAIRDVGQVFQSLGNIIIRVVLPPLKSFVDGITDIIVFMREHERYVVMFFTAIATVLTASLIPAFVKLAAALWANPLTWLIAGLAMVVAYLEDLYGYVNGWETADFIKPLWQKLFGTPEEARNSWLYKFIQDPLGALKEAPGLLFDKLSAYFTSLMDRLEVWWAGSDLNPANWSAPSWLPDIFGKHRSDEEIERDKKQKQANILLEQFERNVVEPKNGKPLTPEEQAEYDRLKAEAGPAARTPAAPPAVGDARNSLIWTILSPLTGDPAKMSRSEMARQTVSNVSNNVSFNNTQITVQADNAQEFARRFPEEIQKYFTPEQIAILAQSSQYGT